MPLFAYHRQNVFEPALAFRLANQPVRFLSPTEKAFRFYSQKLDRSWCYKPPCLQISPAGQL